VFSSNYLYCQPCLTARILSRTWFGSIAIRERYFIEQHFLHGASMERGMVWERRFESVGLCYRELQVVLAVEASFAPGSMVSLISPFFWP
jgi:hypothetical protein